jgi:hypothetical protein
MYCQTSFSVCIGHYTLSLVFDRLDIPSSSTTELSELGRDFFTRLFERSDKVNVP